MSERNPLDAAIIEYLRDLSDSWANISDRRATKEEALDLLVKSGLAEVRTDITIRMDGKTDVVTASVVISGRHDLRQVTYPLIAATLAGHVGQGFRRDGGRDGRLPRGKIDGFWCEREAQHRERTTRS